MENAHVKEDGERGSLSERSCALRSHALINKRPCARGQASGREKVIAREREQRLAQGKARGLITKSRF